MDLKVLGSSSSGNGYILDNGKEALVIEAGIPLAEVKKALSFDIQRITGVLVTHEHGDHAKYVGSYLDAALPVYASKGTIEALDLGRRSSLHEARQNSCLRPSGGNFEVIPFGVQHDAAEPFGFLIRHLETGIVLYATDTKYLFNTFEGLNNILIECNYRQDLLDRNPSISKRHRDRVIQSHMSYETCLETLLANDLKAVNNIVLIHLSSDNSNERDFVEGVHKATGKTVTVASVGTTLPFNKTPF